VYSISKDTKTSSTAYKHLIAQFQLEGFSQSDSPVSEFQ